MKKQNYLLFLIITCFILLFVVFYLIDYLVKNNYIVECFSNSNNSNYSSSQNTHTVDLPLNTTYSCSNFCGPNARCATTGQQCLADIDCPGCQPYKPPSKQHKTHSVPGDNDAGKLTLGVTPQYSSLTSDIGTQALVITNDKFSKPSMANFGSDTWSKSFAESEELFNKRYKPNNTLTYMPSYPKRYSATGQFYESGPLASNAYLS